MQESTCEFWEKLGDFTVYVSSAVEREAGQGDAQAAAKRLAAIKPFVLLETNSDIDAIAQELIASGAVPQTAPADAAHIAIAAWYNIEFIVTWNFAHIANVDTMHLIEAACSKHHRRMPRIVTPEFFLHQ